MDVNDLFFIHVPKTGGTYVKFSIPELPSATMYNLPTHSCVEDIHHVLNNRLLFTVVRDPYDWLESFYFWNNYGARAKKRDKNILKYETFDSFILDAGFKFLPGKQSDYIHGIPKSCIIKTENLTSELDSFLLSNGIKHDLLPNKVRENITKPNIFWSEEMRVVVNDYYADDFILLDYKFKD